MHKSRLAGFIIDCHTADLDAAARFWSAALGLPVKSQTESAYRIFETGADGLHIEVQQVEHPSRVHLDIEADDIEAEVARLRSSARGERKGAHLVGDAGADRPALLCRAPAARGLCSRSQHWE